MPEAFETRLARLEERIQRAAARAGRARPGITLIAVTKKFSAARIEEAYGAGQRDFGENYVQEFSAKRAELGGLAEARFHLIGHLQSNKARLASELFDTIQTVDSARLARRLNEHRPGMEVLIEVHLSGEAAKSGVRPAELEALVETIRRDTQLRLTGLMTMPPWSEDAETSRPFFARLRELAARFGLPSLSMGMSNDFEVAIEEGATHIRVGTALFGSRRPG